MSATVYKLIHLVGIFAVLIAVGGICFHAAVGGAKSNEKHRLATLLHGVGLFLVLLGGFGMLAKLSISVASGWVLVKLAIWIAIGALVAIPYRKPDQAINVAMLTLLLAIVAGVLALYKPF
ncbi:MAG: hypothetical protein HKN43_04010 [Rhodothermales bacterium]|nr:hypothetical protein [Rhodothermales bacterium]